MAARHGLDFGSAERCVVTEWFEVFRKAFSPEAPGLWVLAVGVSQMGEISMIRTLRVVVLLAGLGLAVPALSLAESVEWDQAAVSQIASELVPAVESAYDELRLTQIGDRNPRDFYLLRETTRRVRSEARRLADGLAAGEGHDPTLPVFEQLLLQVHDARKIARRIFLSTPLHDKLVASGELVDRLAAFYTDAS